MYGFCIGENARSLIFFLENAWFYYPKFQKNWFGMLGGDGGGDSPLNRFWGGEDEKWGWPSPPPKIFYAAISESFVNVYPTFLAQLQHIRDHDIVCTNNIKK